MHDSQKADSQREARIISHALVEIKKYKWWPFGIQSAILLDITSKGFKFEFTGITTCKAGDQFTMIIPLLPFGIKSPQSIGIPIVVRWFDPKKMRVGGEFLKLNRESEIFINQIVDHVTKQNLGNI